MKSQVGERFSEFFEIWIHQLDEYSKQLLIESNGIDHFSEAEKESLVTKLKSHHKNFYIAKWKSAHEDILAFYCPIWLTKLENAYSWLTGWKPSMVFRLVESMRSSTRVQPGPGLSELTEEQVSKIEELRVKIKVEEARVDMEMERQQVKLADRKVVDLVRLVNRVKNGELVVGQVGQVDGLVQVALKGLLVGLEKVMKSADCVRLKILKGILEVLSPSQSVSFLACTSMAQINLRQWGQRRDIQMGPT